MVVWKKLYLLLVFELICVTVYSNIYVAMLSLQTVFMFPKDSKTQADQVRLKFAVHEGDHLTLLNGILCAPSCLLTNFLFLQFIMGSFLMINPLHGAMNDSSITNQWQEQLK
jgi:hypothetical protein